MHHVSATTTALDYLLPPSRAHYDSRPSAAYSQTGWSQSLFPPAIYAPAYRAASPDQSCRSTGTRRFAADHERWLQNPSNLLPTRSIDGRLPTPPADDMSVYQPQQSSTIGLRQANTFPSIAAYQSSSAAQGYPFSYPSRAAEASTLGNGVGLSSKQYDGRPQHEVTNGTSERIREGAAQKKDAIHPNMQIPASVNNSGGSIGELAAQLTCLFWFETTETLRKAENWAPNSSRVERLAPDAIPTLAFRKWVITILSTTQVTQNVILLALLFIYRLKTLNPTVKGKAGSEYRLLTVALMLGNKFLDDNTYTNKTWAEVSGISVLEIHVMEVEFLSNMRYSLLASKEQWAEWQGKLAKFADYFEKASRVPLPSPVHNGFPAAILPSPTSIQGHSPALPPQPSNPASLEYSQQWPSHYPPQSLPQPIQHVSKKRPFDDVWVEPPPKRTATMAATQIPAVMMPNPQIPTPRQNLPRLSVPNLSISTSASMGYPAFAQTLPPLPPLNGRAMSQAYPATPSWTPQPQLTLPPAGLQQPQPPYSLPGSNHGTPSSRRHSPRSIGVRSMNSSPISGIFPSSAAAQQQHEHLHSPSIFLQQRDSPYKPVRLPNTLLYPPPASAGFGQHHLFHPGAEMHYQPLGKRNDYRTGVVPEYVGHPGYQQWPPLPQPVFHMTN